MKRQFQAKPAKKSPLMKRCATLVAVGALASLGVACGVAPKAEQTAPAVKKSVTYAATTNTKETKEPTKKPIRKVKATWARLDLDGDVKLLVEWGGGAVLQAEKDGTTSLHTVGTELHDELYAESHLLIKFKGKLRGLLAKADQLLMLRETNGSVELALGTMVEGALQWKTIQTYSLAEAPQFLGRHRNINPRLFTPPKEVVVSKQTTFQVLAVG